MTPQQRRETLRQLKTRNEILLWITVEERSQWWTTTRDLAELAGVSLRRAELTLALLVRDGWIEREEKGSQNHTRLVRFRVAPIDSIGAPRSTRSVSSDRSDRCGAIDSIGEQRSTRSVHTSNTHARGPAPPDLPLAKGSDPSVHPEGSGEDTRTGVVDVRGSDVKWTAAQWSVSNTVAHQMVKRLGELGLSRRELREYLAAAKRGSHAAFRGLELAKYPLGAACTAERVTPWLEWRRKSPPATAPAPARARQSDALTHEQVEEHAARAQRAARGVGTEAEAIGVLVSREVSRRG